MLVSCGNPYKKAMKDLGYKEGLFAEMVTSKGTIIFTLEYEKAPITVANFVGLAEGAIENSHRPLGTPFFDSLIFHRVEPNFVIQGGDPMGNGYGGPGYRFKTEVSSDLKHDKAGTVAMANSGPNSNGSQFYITHIPTPFLDGGYNVFGYVISGMDVVNSIQVGDTIESVTIIRLGKEAKDFDAAATMQKLP
ncbi:MAG: peptidylprolyl isomerase [Flavobacteriales bacterium]|nr:peptidylprolyl isomerase [Bacteroidota bacterium]MCB9239763.1 peptidylprolyl isomerase [Flavobacteriales bacterium]